MEKRGNGSLGKEYYGDATKPTAIPANKFKTASKISSAVIQEKVVTAQPTVQATEGAREIYAKLGNKTQSENVVIKPWGELKDATKAVTTQGIIATRIKNSDAHFGNPFSHDIAGKKAGFGESRKS